MKAVQATPPTPAARGERFQATFWLMFLFDIAEGADLSKARDLIGQSQHAGRTARPPLPAYAGFEKPPLICNLPSKSKGISKLFPYGVLCIEWEHPFEGTWPDLVQQSSRLQEAQPEACREAESEARALAAKFGAALDSPYETWLNEDYLIVHIESLTSPGGGDRMPAEQVIAQYGGPIAQVVRGESTPLADRERDEVLSGRLSCYGSDLLVAGWAAALVYEPHGPGLMTMQLLEHANAQLLEFRHYETVLDRVLVQLRHQMEKPSGLFTKWRMARRAKRLNALRLDVMELADRSEHSLRFLGDMYDARAYRMAAQRIGVDDYRAIVSAKLNTAGELYHFLVEEFHQQRAFLLEALVVIILIVELWDVLFRHR